MYFCPNCLNNLDIGKSSTKTEDKRTVIKIADIFKLLQDNEDLSKYKAGFDKSDLTKNKKYQLLVETDKYKI
jgi:hypothetical protein